MKTGKLKNMSKEEKEMKLKELKLELVKAKISTSKGGNSKIKNIRKAIAQILTLNK